ncbi:hypothetical protein NKG05_14965 [Oerskovia sp. M15]
MLTAAATLLETMIERLRKAAGIYEESESAIETGLSWLAEIPVAGLVVLAAAGLRE